jgi:hypothetical protein
MKHKKSEISIALVLIVTIVILWCWVYNRTTIEAWNTPLVYAGDAWWTLGTAKGYLDGEAFPILQKSVESLNAPFSANLNDWPLTEEFIYAAIGWLGRGIGLFASSNVMVLLAHVLAGLSFWYVAKALRFRTALAFAGAVLYAFSHYSFARNLGHLGYTYYWHAPLFLLVTWWCFSKGRIVLWEKKWWIAVVISFITGTFNPYYTAMYVQLLGFVFLLHLVRRQWHEARIPFLLGCITVGGFLLMNADTLSYQFSNGSNPHAVTRSLADLERNGLVVPQLFLPSNYHRWHWLANFGQTRYFTEATINGEMGSPYLGFAGLAGFLWLASLSFFRLLQGRLDLIPVQALQTLWVLLYSLVGGINLLAGVFGFLLFRGTNRYSIIILTIALLFLVRQLSRQCRRNFVLPVALALLLIGLWDQVPPSTVKAQIDQTAQLIQSDRVLVDSMESALPAGSMVFQLPVYEFPEIGTYTYRMADYDHFRPYLFSHHLHFSYGSHKGRPLERWQREVERMPSVRMAAKLEEYGFSAIYINRKGFADRGEELLSALRAAGKPVVAESGSGDLIAIGLTPSATPLSPEIPPFFAGGWSVDERTHRWSTARVATIEFWNTRKENEESLVEFTLGTLKTRQVKVSINGSPFETVQLERGKDKTIGPKEIVMRPGNNVLRFETDVPPEYFENGDIRKFSFFISNFKHIIKDSSTK